MTGSETEWDVSAGTSRTIEALLAVQFAVIGGVLLLAGASPFLAFFGRYAVGTTTVELAGILAFVVAAPVLTLWAALRALTGSEKGKAVAMYAFSDPAHPDRTIFDHAPPRQYVAAATVGFVGYLGAIFAFGFRPEHVLGAAVAVAFSCRLLWWTAPNRGRLDVESGTLVVYNRRTLTEGGSASARNLLRGFGDDDRRTTLEDVTGTSAIRVGDVVVVALRHRSGYGPTLAVVPPRVADRIARIC